MERDGTVLVLSKLSSTSYDMPREAFASVAGEIVVTHYAEVFNANRSSEGYAEIMRVKVRPPNLTKHTGGKPGYRSVCFH